MGFALVVRGATERYKAFEPIVPIKLHLCIRTMGWGGIDSATRLRGSYFCTNRAHANVVIQILVRHPALLALPAAERPNPWFILLCGQLPQHARHPHHCDAEAAASFTTGKYISTVFRSADSHMLLQHLVNPSMVLRLPNR